MCQTDMVHTIVSRLFSAVRRNVSMLEIKSGTEVLGRLRPPDDHGCQSWWRRLLNALGVVHHCGVACKKVEPSNHWHSATYECQVCGVRFWTWSETGWESVVCAHHKYWCAFYFSIFYQYKTPHYWVRGECYFRSTGRSLTSWSQISRLTSETIRQSPRGETATEPILGPSGRQLRLNCERKKRSKNFCIQCLISAGSISGKLSTANR